MRDEVRETIKQANDSGVTLLFTDLELAQTMLDRAELARDSETRDRNMGHARRACESVSHFLEKLNLRDDERLTLMEKLHTLTDRVQKLQKLQPRTDSP